MFFFLFNSMEGLKTVPGWFKRAGGQHYRNWFILFLRESFFPQLNFNTRHKWTVFVLSRAFSATIDSPHHHHHLFTLPLSSAPLHYVEVSAEGQGRNNVHRLTVQLDSTFSLTGSSFWLKVNQEGRGCSSGGSRDECWKHVPPAFFFFFFLIRKARIKGARIINLQLESGRLISTWKA